MKMILAASFIFLACVHVYLGRPAVREFSPTYDEPVHTTAGYLYLKTGDYRFQSRDHPAFAQMWAAVPLLWLKPLFPLGDAWSRGEWRVVEQYRFADRFLYHNRVTVDQIMTVACSAQAALSILFGAVVMTAAFFLGGAAASLTAGVLWAFSPAVLAAGTLVSTDLAFAFFFFAFFAALWRMRSIAWNVAAGLSLGLCMASKYFAVAIFPILAALWIWEWGRKAPAGQDPLFGRGAGRAWAVITAVAVFSLLAVYRFSNLDSFWHGLSQIVGRSQAGRSSFFWGRHGTEGWLLYFPFAFLVKTPIPLLAATLGAIWLAMRRRIEIPAILWIPPTLFFLLSCLSKVQIGHRHLLAVYPFLFVMSGLAIAHLNKAPRLAALCTLSAWLAIEGWIARPHYLSYFNSFVGGPENGYKYLTDSNVDWGQGLKVLGQSLSAADRQKGIYLSYFGTADPHAYGIRYVDIASDQIVGREDDLGAPGVAPTALAVSVTNLQSTYYRDKTFFDWLKGRAPSRVVARSIFIYDFSDDPEALKRLSDLRLPNT